MKVSELLTSVRNTLQDLDENYWDDSELLSYYNECKRSMAAERLEGKTTATLTLDPLKNEYDTSGILRYIYAEDDLDNDRALYPNDRTGEGDAKGIIVLDYNRIYINDPSLGTTLTMQVIALPAEDNLSSNVRFGDENAMKYYILSKSYEKDSDMENFQKSDVFYRKYLEMFKPLKDAANANYTTNTVQISEAIYY